MTDVQGIRGGYDRPRRILNPRSTIRIKNGHPTSGGRLYGIKNLAKISIKKRSFAGILSLLC